MEFNTILKSTKIFYDLGEEELTEIAYSITEKQYQTNSIILQEGSTTQALYIIREGQVSIEIPMGNDYLQLAVYSESSSAMNLYSRLKNEYPVTVLVSGTSSQKSYKVMVGPLHPDESGLILYKFKLSGYKDAFIRKGQ